METIFFRSNHPGVRKLLAVVAGCLSLVATETARAFNPVFTKLYSGSRVSLQDNYFGDSVSLSDRFLVVGALDDDDASDGGGVHVFDAISGRFLRRISPAGVDDLSAFGYALGLSGNQLLASATKDPGFAYLFDVRSGRQLRVLQPAALSVGDGFGTSLALAGHLAWVAAPGDDDSANNSGAAYLFDFSSSQAPLKVKAPDPSPDQRFGSALSMTPQLALVGADQRDALSPNPGVVYCFDAKTGSFIFKLSASDGADHDQFGAACAISGHLALIGAPLHDVSGENDGAAYLFDLRTGLQIAKFSHPDPLDFSYFGRQVAMDGHLAFIASNGSASLNQYQGVVHVFDLTDFSLLGRLTAPDTRPFHAFGYSASTHANQVAIGASGDNDLAQNSGAVYLVNPIPSPMPLASFAARGGFAPGTQNTQFNAFTQATISGSGAVILNTTLSGPGASGGRNQGVWTQLNANGVPSMALRTRDTDLGGNLSAARITNAWIQADAFSLIEAVLAGPGVNGANRQALLSVDANGLQLLARTGADSTGMLGGAVHQRFVQIAQFGTMQNRVVINSQLRRGNGVNASNDAAICFFRHDGDAIGLWPRKGVTAVTTLGTMGQPFARVSASAGSDYTAFGSFVIVPPVNGPSRSAIFHHPHLNGDLSPVAIQGAAPAHPGGARLYRSFLAEAPSSGGYLLWRASLSGGGVTSRDNEGLWHENNESLMARKGDEIDPAGQPGARITRLLRFWPVGDFQWAVILVRLGGVGITSANDLALCLWDLNAPNSLQILMQEGDAVEGTDGAVIRNLQRVDVEPVFGHYVVLCSLSGPAVRNQALFTGRVSLGDAATLKARRLPALAFRKGTLFRSLAGATRLRSLSFTQTTDRTGVGGKGLGQAINMSGELVLTAEFDNRAREVLRGKP